MKSYEVKKDIKNLYKNVAQNLKKLRKQDYCTLIEDNLKLKHACKMTSKPLDKLQDTTNP